MRTMWKTVRDAAMAVAAACLIVPAWAQPLVPKSDDEVIERFPPRVVPRVPERSGALSADQATQWAARLVSESRQRGDPRPAGEALAILAPWAADRFAPAPLIVTLADAEQHLHRFDASRQRLEVLVQRDPSQPQAWLMLATLHRVQGRYAESDVACERLRRLQQIVLAHGCLGENEALRGREASARRHLAVALAAAPTPALRSWLHTTLAEMEERRGDDRAAEAAYRAALANAGDGYTALAYADLLIRQRRGREARVVLKDEAPSDAVLLRVALAEPADAVGRAAASRLKERAAQADLAPQARGGHERERAMAALHLARDAKAALQWAQRNVQSQREPIDLALLLASARAAGDPAAVAQAHRLIEETGLVDRRLHALL